MSTSQPNVLFLLSDEHSYRGFSHLDADGRGEPVDTPVFDDLAASSTRFDQTYCQMPLCSPSRISLLTGRRPMGAGAWDNWSTLPPELETLPEAFSAAGYETCLQGKMHLGGSRQFVGFDHRPYGDLTGETGHQPDPIRPHEQSRGLALKTRTRDAGVTEIPESLLQEQNVVRETVSFIREQEQRDPDQPWFVCASLSRPHFPLTAPERHFDRYWPEGVTDPKVGREGDLADHPVTEAVAEGFEVDNIGTEERQRARAAYFACIDYLDEIVGDLLGMLERGGQLENTIVVYASDHGELAGEHGLWWKHTWHEASTRVPLFIQTPEQRAGEQPARDISTPVGLVDLFPTLCGLAGVDAPDDLDGGDLSRAVRTGEEPDRGPVVCDNLNPRWGEGTEFRVVRDGRYKYVQFRDAPALLFDTEADPLEQHNLVDEPEHQSALADMRAYVSETLDFEAAERKRLDDEERLSKYDLGLPSGTDGNAYHLSDGRIIDAGVSLYKPHVLIEEPSVVYDDWPGAEQ